MENHRFPREVTLCLSGGAARGAFHLGVISVLQERNIKIKAISGASIGALIGASFASGRDASEILEILKSREFKKVFKFQFFKSHLFKIDIYAPVIMKLINKETFKELGMPFEISISNIDDSKIEYRNDGDNFRELVLASCSVSPLIAPVELHGKLLADGGIIDNFPVQRLKKFPYKIIGVNLYPCKKIRPKSIIGWMRRVVFLSWQAPNIYKKDLCDVYVSNDKLNDLKTFSFKDLDKAYELGRESMQQAISSY